MKIALVKYFTLIFLLCSPNSKFGEIKVTYDFHKPSGHSGNAKEASNITKNAATTQISKNTYIKPDLTRSLFSFKLF